MTPQDFLLASISALFLFYQIPYKFSFPSGFIRIDEWRRVVLSRTSPGEGNVLQATLFLMASIHPKTYSFWLLLIYLLLLSPFWPPKAISSSTVFDPSQSRSTPKPLQRNSQFMFKISTYLLSKLIPPIEFAMSPSGYQHTIRYTFCSVSIYSKFKHPPVKAKRVVHTATSSILQSGSQAYHSISFPIFYSWTMVET